MATTSIYVQLKGGRPPRKITATSLAWFFGRCTTITLMYEGTAGTGVKIDTFTHRQESTPEPSAGSFANIPSTDPTKAITVAQNQIAIESAGASSSDKSTVQFAPAVLNTTTAASASDAGVGRNFASPARVQRIIGESCYDYIRFTGTELPTGGIIIPRSEIVCMFSADTAPTDL